MSTISPSLSSSPTKLLEVPYADLNDGTKIPLLGFGTSNVIGRDPGDPGYEAIKTAIRCGYRFIDTAALYMNEEAVGNAIHDCIADGVVKREDLYICTKVWNTRHKRESVTKACRESLSKLRLDYLDLYLIHWPTAYVEDGDPINPKDPETGKLLYSDTHYTETWRGMEDVKDAGLSLSIGLSNFNHEMCDAIFNLPCKYKPAVNQIEAHPYLTQEKLLDYSNKTGIVLTAYCPLGSPGSCAAPDQPAVLEDPVVKELAEKYNKTTAQILVRFHLDRNISVIPKSVNPVRIKENFQVLDFKLSDEDLDMLLELDQNLRYCLNIAGEYIDDHPHYPFKLDY